MYDNSRPILEVSWSERLCFPCAVKRVMENNLAKTIYLATADREEFVTCADCGYSIRQM